MNNYIKVALLSVGLALGITTTDASAGSNICYNNYQVCKASATNAEQRFHCYDLYQHCKGGNRL